MPAAGAHRGVDGAAHAGRAALTPEPVLAARQRQLDAEDHALDEAGGHVAEEALGEPVAQRLAAAEEGQRRRRWWRGRASPPGP